MSCRAFFSSVPLSSTKSPASKRYRISGRYLPSGETVWMASWTAAARDRFQYPAIAPPGPAWTRAPSSNAKAMPAGPAMEMPLPSAVNGQSDERGSYTIGLGLSEARTRHGHALLYGDSPARVVGACDGVEVAVCKAPNGRPSQPAVPDSGRALGASQRNTSLGRPCLGSVAGDGCTQQPCLRVRSQHASLPIPVYTPNTVAGYRDAEVTNLDFRSIASDRDVS